MNSEMLKIFDDYRNPIGVSTREEVHRFGHWHETFHCWFISREGDKDYIYLQLRSDQKKDYPNLLDITAAGHILAHETVLDGIREVHEEIGIEVTIDELESLGVIDYTTKQPSLIDKELANVFLYRYTKTLEDFTLQEEEVAGIFKAEFDDFYDIWHGEKEQIQASGFIIECGVVKVPVNKMFDKNHFVPHEESFYQHIARLIRECLIKKPFIG
ncbi:NUDIX hydrolase [Bacillus sp. FJAT-27264]|uniref:NUDIX hydrolase n=1 Tax=Paenibacillus sp. (strain DSM 101736 / FJAT-27264) TaxID=1850362 RepID=UPI0008080B79|nr:NUDIX domain-containing protein [Bacillus sp. FJAT-27264]OBZ14002.1 NUDIX hydrolase [Bacillus sp. FJAT-27264]